MKLGQIYGTGAPIDIEPSPVAGSPQEAGFWGEVDRFKGKADEFYRVWQGLRAKRQAASASPELQREYSDVMGEADTVVAKMSDVERVVGAVRETVTGWFGVEGYRQAGRTLMGLGALPLLPIALITAAIAWITGWLGKAYLLDRKLTSVETMIAGGVDPSEAGRVVHGDENGGFFAGLGGELAPLALAGVAIAAVYFMSQRGR